MLKNSPRNDFNTKDPESLNRIELISIELKRKEKMFHFLKHEGYTMKFKMTLTGMDRVKFLVQLVNEDSVC